MGGGASGWWSVGIVTKNRNEMMNGFRGEKFYGLICVLMFI